MRKMSKVLTLSLLLHLAVLSILNTASAAWSEVWSDSWETEGFPAWVWDDAQRVGSPVIHGSYSCEMIAFSGIMEEYTGFDGLYTIFNASFWVQFDDDLNTIELPEVFVEYYIGSRTGEGVGSDTELGIQLLDTLKLRLVDEYGNSATGSTLITNSTWYRLDVLVDIPAQEAELYLNGSLECSYSSSWNSSETVGGVIFQAENGNDYCSYVYLDGFQISRALNLMPWDITGSTPWVPDGKCDIRDVAIVAIRFGSVEGDGSYDERADITGPTYLVADGKIDIRDIALVALHYGEVYQ